MLRAAFLLLMAACGGSSSGAGASREQPPPSSPAPSDTAAPDEPVAPPACPLDWDEERAVMPSELPLASWPAAVSPDECPSGFDPAEALATCAPPDCAAGLLAPGRPAALVIEGPAGSGRFVALGLAVGGAASGPRFACLQGSTVGWRHFAAEPAARSLAPLPWLTDADGDGTAELIVWHRVAWGSSEIENGLVPAAYRLDADRLVRRDTAAAPLARRVAAAYRSFIAPPSGVASAPGPASCYAALAAELDRWGAR